MRQHSLLRCYEKLSRVEFGWIQRVQIQRDSARVDIDAEWLLIFRYLLVECLHFPHRCVNLFGSVVSFGHATCNFYGFLAVRSAGPDDKQG